MDATAPPKRLLVVEDDADIREVLLQVLSSAGYDAVGAANGLEALQSLKSSPDFGLIILDLMMPVMNGWQFRTLQQRDPTIANIPVVVLSAGVHLQQQANAIRAAAYLKKPIQLDHLLDAIGRHVQ